MAEVKPEVEITGVRLEKATRFKRLPEVQKEVQETNHVNPEYKELEVLLGLWRDD